MSAITAIYPLSTSTPKNKDLADSTPGLTFRSLITGPPIFWYPLPLPDIPPYPSLA